MLVRLGPITWLVAVRGGTGTAGGQWHRDVGTATETVTVEGPGWAWVVLCSRRVELDVVRPHLAISGSDDAVEQIETARAFL